MIKCPHCQRETIDQKSRDTATALWPIRCPECGGLSFGNSVMKTSWFFPSCILLATVVICLAILVVGFAASARVISWSTPQIAAVPMVIASIFIALLFFIQWMMPPSTTLIATTADVVANQRRRLYSSGIGAIVVGILGLVVIVVLWGNGAI